MPSFYVFQVRTASRPLHYTVQLLTVVDYHSCSTAAPLCPRVVIKDGRGFLVLVVLVVVVLLQSGGKTDDKDNAPPAPVFNHTLALASVINRVEPAAAFR